MNNDLFVRLSDVFNSWFPEEWIKSALLLALICACILAALTGFLTRLTNRSYYKKWFTAWLFYVVWLVVGLGLESYAKKSILEVFRPACLGLSAYFLLWGSLQFAESRLLRFWPVLAVAMGLLTAGGCGLVYQFRDDEWSQNVLFVLLAAVMIFTGLQYLRERDKNRGAKISATAFIAWGVCISLFPFITISRMTESVGFIVSGVLTLCVTIGMVVEQEVRQSEEKYRPIFERASDAIFLVDLWSLAILDANQAAERLVDRKTEEVVGRPITEIFPDLQKDGNSESDHVRMFESVIRPYAQFQVAGAADKHTTCEGETNLVYWHKQPVLQINCREIGQHQKIGQQMRRNEKLSSLGQLVAGVAHELNNPLAVVMGYAQILTKRQVVDERIRGDMMKILHESERAAKIVRNLLTFARPSEPQKVSVDINKIVSSVLEVREAEFRSNGVQLEKRLAQRLPQTKADPSQLEQVLTNIIGNAYQAMLGHTGTRKLAVSTEENGFTIRICVSDTGPGIPKEILTRIFDPFFTTKPPGKGTGLGLTICNAIISEHRGKVWAESELGHGAKFIVELPIVSCDEETAADAKSPAEQAPARKPMENASQHRLLLVDDEPGIVEVMREVLSSHGYNVDTACNGAEAIRRITTNKYDLVISDLCMPEMDGTKLFKAITERAPHLSRRIIFVTGDTVSTKSRSFLESSGTRWLSKPFNIAEVEELVASILSGESPQMAPAGSMA